MDSRSALRLTVRAAPTNIDTALPFSIVSLSFKQGNKWRLNDGRTTLNVTVVDDEFLRRVDHSEVAFSKGDILICDVRVETRERPGGLHAEFFIERVIEHRKPAQQPSLFGHDSAQIELRAGPQMRCPYCGGLDTQVKDSRPTEDSSSIRRRRICPDCGGRFTTFERVQLRELMVVKKNGRRAPFDRDKLVRSVQVALRKRSVEPERVERMINGVVRQLESQTDGDIPTERIGELVMEGLKALDDIAYVRFASVYRNFREARDFNAIVGELEAEPEPAPVKEVPRQRRNAPAT